MTNNHKKELIKNVIINGINYNVYAVFCVNNSGYSEPCGYDIYRGKKYIATCINIPDEKKIVKMLEILPL